MLFNYSHPPNWLEANSLFQYIFLLRKLFLTRTRFHHFSQFAEDISIGRLFPKGFKGVYVDVGCFHPRKYNNTWKLYKAGWRGINIDIDAIKIKGFNIVRPHDHNIACAVSAEIGTVEYFSNGFYSLTTTMSEDFSQKRSNYIKKTSICKPLNLIIEESPFAERSIDFLSIDVEGHDLEALKSLNFRTHTPSVIAIESHAKSLKEVNSSPEFRFLTEHGFDLVAWCGLTLILAHESHLAQLKQ